MLVSRVGMAKREEGQTTEQDGPKDETESGWVLVSTRDGDGGGGGDRHGGHMCNGGGGRREEDVGRLLLGRGLRSMSFLLQLARPFIRQRVSVAAQ